MKLISCEITLIIVYRYRKAMMMAYILRGTCHENDNIPHPWLGVHL